MEVAGNMFPPIIGLKLPVVKARVPNHGTGQVVAVSDTGIDQNNCYFSDHDNTPSDVGGPLQLLFVVHLVLKVFSLIHIAIQKYDGSHQKIVQYIDYVDNSD